MVGYKEWDELMKRRNNASPKKIFHKNKGKKELIKAINDGTATNTDVAEYIGFDQCMLSIHDLCQNTLPNYLGSIDDALTLVTHRPHWHYQLFSWPSGMKSCKLFQFSADSEQKEFVGSHDKHMPPAIVLAVLEIK